MKPNKDIDCAELTMSTNIDKPQIKNDRIIGSGKDSIYTFLRKHMEKKKLTFVLKHLILPTKKHDNTISSYNM